MQKETISQLEDVIDIRSTRNNLAALLLAYYGAVAFEQVRADERHHSPGRRDKSYWRDYRKEHLRQLRLLLDTLADVSKETLVKVTVLAATCRAVDVRNQMVELLSWGSFAEVADERLYEAPEFFEKLVKKTRSHGPMSSSNKGALQKMMRWLDPLDPLQIADQVRASNATRPGRVRSRVIQY